ncbi:MAG: hypothetical protein OEY64_03275 [Nitrospinota bacterium]|nr:hypothetical protein [Nitrospinota bacterium]
MKKYKVIGASANFHSGKLQVTEEQFKARSHALKKLTDEAGGTCEILSPVQFKRGEEIGYDGAVSKSLLADISPADDTPGSDGDNTADTPPDPVLAILDGNVSQVIDALGDCTGEELANLKAAEEAGKTRKSVIKAIDDELAKRADKEEEAELLALIPDYTDEDLQAVKEEELEGANRETIIKAIDDELAKREADKEEETE